MKDYVINDNTDINIITLTLQYFPAWGLVEAKGLKQSC